VGSSGGTIVWDIPSIPAGNSVTLTFDARIKTLESPACEAENRSCTNHVTVVGNCADATARARGLGHHADQPVPEAGALPPDRRWLHE
jgi:hypothetical protein